MANDIGMAVTMLKQLLADDKAKETLSGMLGGLLGNSEFAEDTHITGGEILDEITENEVIDAQISMPEKKKDVSLPGILANMDVQGIYNSMVGCEDKRINLLHALRPYLSSRRCEKIDSAITIIQLVSISSTLGIDKMFGR